MPQRLQLLHGCCGLKAFVACTVMLLIVVLLLTQLAEPQQPPEHLFVFVLRVLGEALTPQLTFEFGNFCDDLFNLLHLRRTESSHLLAAMHQPCRKLPLPFLQVLNLHLLLRHGNPGACCGLLWQHCCGQDVQARLERLEIGVLGEVRLPVTTDALQSLPVVNDLAGEALQLVDVLRRRGQLTAGQLRLQLCGARSPRREEPVDVLRQALRGQQRWGLLRGGALELAQRPLGLAGEPRCFCSVHDRA
mmetsp:Transcript_54309/g.154698  ORF Transcript_54309/g.154698 Transcript_54309/m.154698 type:complete len:247 (-) Transcript_54309:287-1027(-)